MDKFEIEKLEDYADELYHQREESNKELEKVYAEINSQKTFVCSITDHALMRYLQREELIPVSEARYKILTEVETFLKTFDKIKLEALKGIPYKLYLKGLVFLIKDFVIYTIYKDV